MTDHIGIDIGSTTVKIVVTDDAAGYPDIPVISINLNGIEQNPGFHISPHTELWEMYPEANIVAVDYDPSASRVNQINRIKLMLENARGELEVQG